MARLPKCPECDYQVDKETQRWVKHSAKTYHESCFQQFEMRKQHRNDLHNYICELYEIPVVNGLMLKQIKEYQEQYNYTLKGMELALNYYFYILGKPRPTDSEEDDYKRRGVGIIPNIYEEAKRYYIKMANITKKASESEFESKEEIVYIKQSPRNRKKDYVDIEGI